MSNGTKDPFACWDFEAGHRESQSIESTIRLGQVLVFVLPREFQPLFSLFTVRMEVNNEEAPKSRLLRSMSDVEESSYGSDDDDDSANDDAESHTNRSTRTLSNLREDIKVRGYCCILLSFESLQLMYFLFFSICILDYERDPKSFHSFNHHFCSHLGAMRFYCYYST